MRRSAQRRSTIRLLFAVLMLAATLALVCQGIRLLLLQQRPAERVLIIGAGAAGLAAAASLSQHASVIVLEAQGRLGGRVHTNRSLGGVPIELGAAWIHRADGNLVTELAEQYGCPTFVSENKRLVVHEESGGRVAATTTATVYDALAKQIMPELLRRRRKLREDGADDWSLGALMASLPSARSLAGVSRCVFDFLLFRDIVQDHTADLWKISAARYDTDHYGGSGKDRILPRGYDCVIRGLASGLGLGASASEIRTGRAGEVTRLQWSETGVLAWTADGRVERADRAIVTVPLGVLKASVEGGGPAAAAPTADDAAASSHGPAVPHAAAVKEEAAPPLPLRFEPPLPAPQARAIRQLGWGEALKVGLRFPKIFWPEDAHFLGAIGGGCANLGSAQHMEFLNVAAYAEGAPPVLLMETEQAHARALAAMDDAGILGVVTGALRRMYPNEYVAPSGHVIARLGQNAFQRGAFPYPPTGGPHALHQALAAPLARGRLLFAGEHTSALHAGTVHGALVSGRRAAAQARAAMAGADAARGGAAYEEEYTRKLFDEIYDDDDDGGGDEEEWDRNP